MSDSQKPLRWTLKRQSGPKRAAARDESPENPKPPQDDLLMAAAAEQFDQQTMPPLWRGCCIHVVNGVELVADPSGTAFWPAEETLLVADLHLEKGSSFAKRGQLLPPYDTVKTLQRLQAAVEKWQPERIIALGDSFHDPSASKRLTNAASATLRTLMAGRDWLWITGNHDPSPPAGLGGESAGEARLGGLILRHEPQIGDATGEVAGHLHPKAKLVKRGRHVRRSCFAASRSRMILPSFGTYTGGLDVFDPAYEGLFEGRNFHALMRSGDQVYRISAKQLTRR